MSEAKIALPAAFALLSSLAMCASEPAAPSVPAGSEEPEKTEEAGPPPAKSAGLHSETLRLTPLEGEIESIDEAELRMRLITLEPGGHTALHVHENRPGIVYIVSGEIYNHPKGKPAERVPAGSIFYETQGYTHYIENRGAVAATLVSADIVTGEED